MATLFRNARQAQHYAAARPSYPKAIFQKIYDSVQCSNDTKDDWLAVDFGCGTGQATEALAEYFPSVLGVDPSPSQIGQAKNAQQRAQYVVGSSSDRHLLESQSSSSSVVCITAFQAAHWFDLPQFYSVVDHVLQPGGVLALLVYGNCKFPDDPVLEQKIMTDLYEVILADYWDPRRRVVESLYQDLETIDQYYDHYETAVFPMSESDVQHESISKIETEITQDELLGYLRSWSGYTTCVEATENYQENTSTDPLYDLIGYLKTKSDRSKINVIWPLKLILSTRKCATKLEEK